MRKLSSMQYVDINNWPEELRIEFSSMLSPFCKEQGSLSESADISLKPLPPISQKVFNDIELRKLESVLSSMNINATFQVLRLHKCASAVALNKTIKLGSEKSRYGNSSTVIIRDKLVEINKFVNCTILIPKEGISNSEYGWLNILHIWSMLAKTGMDFQLKCGLRHWKMTLTSFH